METRPHDILDSDFFSFSSDLCALGASVVSFFSWRDLSSSCDFVLSCLCGESGRPAEHARQVQTKRECRSTAPKSGATTPQPRTQYKTTPPLTGVRPVLVRLVVRRLAAIVVVCSSSAQAQTLTLNQLCFRTLSVAILQMIPRAWRSPRISSVPRDGVARNRDVRGDSRVWGG